MLSRTAVVVGIFIIGLLLAMIAPAQGSGVLRSALDRPDHLNPISIAAGPTLGGTPDWGSGSFGFDASILFPPDRAAMFSPSLYHWNAGIVLDMEWRPVAEGRSSMTADVIVRKYLAARGGAGAGAVLFAGLGGGRMLAAYPAVVEADPSGGAVPSETTTVPADQRWWSVVFEIGYETEPARGVLITAAGRWRSYVQRPLDYSAWTVRLQVGIPIPW